VEELTSEVKMLRRQGAVTKKPALVRGVQCQPAEIVSQFKKNLLVEPTKIGFNKVLVELTGGSVFLKGCVVIA
jgi:hypothetical protein